MLVVVASEHDAPAGALLAQWAELGARRLSPRDLSRPGWCHHVGGTGEEWAVVSGERVPARDIRGVITRLPLVREQDLAHIVAEDREYVAAEMNATLLSWLTSLRCPVLNRPTSTSLMGRNLSHERWLVFAVRAGLSLATNRRLGTDVERPRVAGAVTVIGDRWIGGVAPALGEQAVRLARIAEVALCTVRFDGVGPDAHFVDADLFTDVGDPRVAGGLLDHIGTGGRA